MSCTSIYLLWVGFSDNYICHNSLFSSLPSVLMLSLERVRRQCFPISQQLFLQYLLKITRHYSIVVFLETDFSAGSGFDKIVLIGHHMCTTIRGSGVVQYPAWSSLLYVLVHKLLYLGIPKILLECYIVPCKYPMHWYICIYTYQYCLQRDHINISYASFF